MLEEYSSAIVNFPDDPDMDGRVSQAQVRAMDAADSDKAFVKDDAVKKEFMDKALTSSALLNDMASVVNRYLHFGRSVEVMEHAKFEFKSRPRPIDAPDF